MWTSMFGELSTRPSTLELFQGRGKQTTERRVQKYWSGAGVIGSRGPDGYCGFAKVRSTVSGFLYHSPGRVSCVLIREGAELYSNIILCSLMVRGQQ